MVVGGLWYLVRRDQTIKGPAVEVDEPLERRDARLLAWLDVEFGREDRKSVV